MFPGPLARFPCRTGSEEPALRGSSTRALWGSEQLPAPPATPVGTGDGRCGEVHAQGSVGKPGAWLLPQRWQGAAGQISGSVGAVTWRLRRRRSRACQRSPAEMLPSARTFVGALLLTAQVERRSGKVIVFPPCSYQRSL